MGRKRRSRNEKKKKPSPKTKKKILQYSEDAMLQALKDVQQGKPVAQAARDHGVPRISLHYKARGKRPIGRKMGPDTELSAEEEARIVEWIFKSARQNFPVTRTNLLDSVKRLLDESGKTSKFTDNRPGKKWINSFLKRHPGVSERIAQNLTVSRANVSPADLTNWSNSVYRYLSENDQTDILYDPSRLFNGDETAFFLNPKGPKVLAPRGEKCIYQTVNSDEKECITVLVTANAEGLMAPPCVVFKYARIPVDISMSVPESWGIGKSESGWMNGTLFFEYITNVFYPWLCSNNIQLPIILFLDGHVSHLNLQASTFCSQNGIILIALYPNATHMIQPMDVAVFRSVKGAWRQKVHDWRLQNIANPIMKKKDFTPLLKEVLDSINPTIISNGFRKCGLYPWNADAPFSSSTTKQALGNVNSPAYSATSTKASKVLEFIENILDPVKLTAFLSVVDEPEGLSALPTEDISLFRLWLEAREKAQAPLKTLTGTPSLLTHEVAADSDECDSPPAQGNSQTSPTTETTSIHEGPNQISELLNTDSAKDPQPLPQIEDIPVQPIRVQPEAHPDALLLPSPFKRAFIYREPGTSTQSNKIRKRELFPSVITSKPWREYHEKKVQQKLDAELKKKERAKERQRKKAEKEELQMRKREERELKKGKPKKKENIPVRQRNARRCKKKLPSSSESDDSVPSMSDDDHESEEESYDDIEEDLAQPLCQWSNKMETGGEDVVCDVPEIYAEPEEDEVIAEIFNVEGLEIDPEEYGALGNDQVRTIENSVVQSAVVDDGLLEGEPWMKEDDSMMVSSEAGVKTENEAQKLNMTPEGAREMLKQHEGVEVVGREVEKGEENGKIEEGIEEGCFVVARFRKNNREVEHVCKIKSKSSDGDLFVILLYQSSRIGCIFEEHSKDIRKINLEQIVKKLPTPRHFGSKLQFPPSI